MYEKHLQNQKASSGLFPTSTQRQGHMGAGQEDEDMKQNRTRIFKYPYLVEKSNEKYREDNQSEKSTQKHGTQAHHRRKIFEPKSAIDSHMKHSTMSAHQLNRNKSNHNFQTNPVRHKIKNSRNKSIPHQQQPPTPLPQQPVSFIYSTPHHQNFDPSLSRLPTFKPPDHLRPDERIQRPLRQPFLGSVQRNNPLGYYSLPVAAENQRAHPQFGNPQFVGQYHSYQPIMLSQPVRVGNQVSRNPHISDYHPKQQIPDGLGYGKTQPNSNSFAQSKPTAEKPQFMPAKPISWVMIQGGNNQHQAKLIKKQTNSHPSIDHKKQSPPKPMQAPQHNVNRNMYETYKIGQRLQKHKFLHVPTNGESPKKAKRRKHQAPSISSFVSVSHAQQQDSVDLHEVEELDDLYLEEAKYSDRFYDMDFKETKKDQNFHNDNKNNIRQIVDDEKQIKNSLPEEPLSLKKMSSERKDYIEKKQATTRKGSITSIAMQRGENKVESEKEQRYRYQEASKRQSFMTRLIMQGKFITFLLIGIGILLVVIQILR